MLRPLKSVSSISACLVYVKPFAYSTCFPVVEWRDKHPIANEKSEDTSARLLQRLSVHNTQPSTMERFASISQAVEPDRLSHSSLIEEETRFYVLGYN